MANILYVIAVHLDLIFIIFVSIKMIRSNLADSPIIQVHNYDSSFDRLYTLTSSFELTYECCSGLGADDHFTLSMFSPTECMTRSCPSRQFIDNYFSGAMHYHDFYELMMVIDGEIIHQINDAEYIYTSGTCCLINRGVSHTERFTGETKVMFLALSPSLFDDLLHDYATVFLSSEMSFLQNPIMEYISRVQKQDQPENSYLDFYPSAWNKSSARELYTLTDSLIRTILNPQLGSGYIVRGIILYIIQFLSDPERYHVSTMIGDSRPDYRLFTHISHFIMDHDGIVSRSLLEQEFHYSGNYINTLIKKYSGSCLFDYRMTFYMERAATLLRETDLSLTEILDKLHASNPTQFYKIFKRTYGLTPTKYRLRWKSHPSDAKTTNDADADMVK